MLNFSFAEEINYDYSFEELMNIEVVSVDKSAQKIADTAASVYVITNEDIKRSGSRTIPEALKLSPGVQVRQLTANSYAVSIRGFDGRLNNKLLVLIDGRSVYTSMFSGVYWQSNQVRLEDVKQIEVIRGPGSTIWGANAVNGVINIITKSASETQGGDVSVSAGDSYQGGSARYGWKLSENQFISLYTLAEEFAELEGGYDDRSRMRQGGLKYDWLINDRETLSVSSDLYSGDFYDIHILSRRGNTKSYGTNFVLNYSKEITDTESLNLKFYYDYSKRLQRSSNKQLEQNNVTVPSDAYDQRVHTYDFDLNYSFLALENHQFIVGTGLRFIDDKHNDNSGITIIEPAEDLATIYNLYIQDKITVIEDQLFLTLGTKLEWPEYADFDLQPSARLMWKINEQNRAWMAYTRSTRSPSRFENRSTLNNVQFLSKGDPENELIDTYEIGYRYLPSADWLLDFSVFYNKYEGLIGVEGDPTSFGPAFLDNIGSGEAYGFEFLSSWKAKDNLKLNFSYSYVKSDYDMVDDLILPFPKVSSRRQVIFEEEDTAEHQVTFSSLWSITEKVNFDLFAYFTGNTQLGTRSDKESGIDNWLQLDAHLSYKVNANCDLHFWVKNLLDDNHPEDYPIGGIQSEVPRSFQVSLNYRF